MPSVFDIRIAQTLDDFRLLDFFNFSFSNQLIWRRDRHESPLSYGSESCQMPAFMAANELPRGKPRGINDGSIQSYRSRLGGNYIRQISQSPSQIDYNLRNLRNLWINRRSNG
jgi:hypothetical protein